MPSMWHMTDNGAAGLAVRDIGEDSGVELGSGWGPALTSYRDLGRKWQDGLLLWLYSSFTLLQMDKYIIVHTLKERGYPLCIYLSLVEVIQAIKAWSFVLYK